MYYFFILGIFTWRENEIWKNSSAKCIHDVQQTNEASNSLFCQQIKTPHINLFPKKLLGSLLMMGWYWEEFDGWVVDHSAIVWGSAVLFLEIRLIKPPLFAWCHYHKQFLHKRNKQWGKGDGISDKGGSSCLAWLQVLHKFCSLRCSIIKFVYIRLAIHHWTDKCWKDIVRKHIMLFWHNWIHTNIILHLFRFWLCRIQSSGPNNIKTLSQVSCLSGPTWGMTCWPGMCVRHCCGSFVCFSLLKIGDVDDDLEFNENINTLSWKNMKELLWSSAIGEGSHVPQ